MKRAFLLIVVPALLVALGLAQTPAASNNADQTNINGCLGGSDGNYTVVQDNTGHTFKITTSGVDLKPHLGHDVSLIGHRASGTSSAAADNSFAVTELTMISEHCAAAAPAATVSTPPETAVTPPAAAAGPIATTSTLPETAVTPAAPAATVTATSETVVTPAAPTTEPAATVTTPAETVVTPPVAPAVPAATANTVSDKPAADAAPPTRRPERSRSLSAAPVAAAVVPAVTASTSSETAITPDAAAASPAAPVTTPDAAATTPAAPARRGTLWLLIAFAVLVIVLGIFVPFLSRWRKQKSLARSGAPNLSFTREASSDQDRPEQPGKAA